ncbi:MAG: formylglycine-generating enzyme family protein [Verrucomicrobia bacterium]|nr:formylglycine-generating enzyme family protein [Verrucomicrobiota bacterium]
MLPNSAIGPNLAIAIDIGGAGNNALDDLYVPSNFNSDPGFRVTLYRNSGKAFTQISNTPATADSARGNRVSLKRGGKEYATFVIPGEKADSLLIGTLDSGKLENILTVPNVPKGSDYIPGYFRGEAVREFVFYTSGEPTITVCPISEAGGKFTAGAMKTFTLPKPITQLVSVEGEKKSRMVGVFEETESAQLMDFDGANAPVVVQPLAGYTNRFLHAALTLSDTIILFSCQLASTNIPTPKTAIYQAYQLKNGNYVLSTKGNLPLLDDRDDSTVPLIHKRIVASLTEKSESDMKVYTNTIPGTGLDYVMTPIPGGEFAMGSPDKEKDRQAGEGPQHRVKISPFWMAKYEVTWQQFLVFVYKDTTEMTLRESNPTPDEINQISDVVTRPSKPYGDMSFGLGQSRGLPAIAMTQHAANKFCHWLSAKTGHFYRLPTEAEWEYACRAGTSTAYFFGDNAADLEKYAWYFDNSDSKYQKIGKKLPNPWGLHDMLGNVAEWVLDQYDESYYQACAKESVSVDPWNKATKPYPHAIRGGAYDDDPGLVRCSSRFKSGPEWKMTYPNLPKTVWWLSDCTKVGFRIVRPLKVPSPEEMAKYWISGVEKD